MFATKVGKYTKEELDYALLRANGENMAELLCEYAKFLKYENQFHLAEQPCTEALKIYRDFAKSNPAAFRSYLATIRNNLAVLHLYTNRYKEAEAECNEALEIRRDLSKNDPS